MKYTGRYYLLAHPRGQPDHGHHEQYVLRVQHYARQRVHVQFVGKQRYEPMKHHVENDGAEEYRQRRAVRPVEHPEQGR